MKDENNGHDGEIDYIERFRKAVLDLLGERFRAHFKIDLEWNVLRVKISSTLKGHTCEYDLVFNQREVKELEKTFIGVEKHCSVGTV